MALAAIRMIDISLHMTSAEGKTMLMQTESTLLTDQEFGLFRDLFARKLGIHLLDHKKTLVSTRLWKRLRACGIESFTDYYRLINQPDQAAELACALELITTNETYFFREPLHFDFLREQILPKQAKNETVSIWSAACSSGEEIYSIAMVLEDLRSGKWELLGSDINQSMLEIAARGIYADQRTDKIPPGYRRRFCLKGTGPFDGCLRIAPALRSKIQLARIELHETLPEIGKFDVIFVRNVMIYFDDAMRRKVVQQIIRHLKPGGFLFVGHSENLRGLGLSLRQVQPAIYQVADPV